MKVVNAANAEKASAASFTVTRGILPIRQTTRQATYSPYNMAVSRKEGGHFAERKIKEWASPNWRIMLGCCRNAFLAAVLWGSNYGRPGWGRTLGFDWDRSIGGMPRPSEPIGMRVRTQMSRSSIALSNLRAVVIVIVLAFHSVLAYLASLPADRLPLRRRALSLAGHPDRRQPALVRLRPVLRLAGCQPDVADVLSVRPVCAVEPGAQRQHHVPLRPFFPDRPAAGRWWSCS